MQNYRPLRLPVYSLHARPRRHCASWMILFLLLRTTHPRAHGEPLQEAQSLKNGAMSFCTTNCLYSNLAALIWLSSIPIYTPCLYPRPLNVRIYHLQTCKFINHMSLLTHNLRAFLLFSLSIQHTNIVDMRLTRMAWNFVGDSPTTSHVRDLPTKRNWQPYPLRWLTRLIILITC